MLKKSHMQKTNVKMLSCVTLKWSLKLPRQNLCQRKPRMACHTCTIACYIVKAEPLILQVINNMRTQEKETLKLNEHHCHWMLLRSSLSICTVLWPMNCIYSDCPWMYILYYGNCQTAWGTICPCYKWIGIRSPSYANCTGMPSLQQSTSQKPSPVLDHLSNHISW
jgi:hypothetical protein